MSHFSLSFLRLSFVQLLRRSDIGQFVTCDDSHFAMAAWRRRGGGSNRVWLIPV